MIEMNEDQLDRLGRLIDKAENYLAASTLKVSAAIHVEGLKSGLEEIRDEARALWMELGGVEFDADRYHDYDADTFNDDDEEVDDVEDALLDEEGRS